MYNYALLFAALLSSTAGFADDKLVLAKSLALLFRSCRAVISESQDLINDASKGDKGLTGEIVVDKCKRVYKTRAGTDVPRDKLHSAMLLSAKEVMDDAQVLNI